MKDIGKDRTEGRRGKRRSKQLLGYLKEKTGYWNLKREASDRTGWRTRFGGSRGPDTCKTNCGMINE
jgi:hypothetical protein